MLGTGTMLSIIEKWTDQRVALLWQSVEMGMFMIVNMIFVCYVAYTIQWYSPLLFILIGVIVFYAIMILARKGQYWREQRTDAFDDRTRHNVKMLMSKYEILMNRKLSQELTVLEDKINKSEYCDLKKHAYEHIGFNIPTIFLSIISIVLFLLLWYKFFYMQSVTYAEIVLYIGLLTKLESFIRDGVNLYKNFIKNFVRVKKLWTTFDDFPTIIWYDRGEKFVYQQGNITFHGVDFMYEKEPILHHLTFSLLWWKKYALVGKSGWGKTTMMKLIAWFLHATSGNISVDNQQLPTISNLWDAISLSSYYHHIGYLTQDPNVFDGTVYENLVYALDYIPTEDDIRSAIQKAECQFIDQLPWWLQTEIGEKWVRLSWWQRQRLAIAKIFLKNPQIILLDEPTSALDSLSEELISQSLDELFVWRTVIIIAHRLQTVKKADEILVIEDGTIIERWDHNQLVNQNGKYKKMLDLQSWF